MFNKIVSFLPSATEIIYLLGSQDVLLGVTHQCNYPPDAKQKPQVIKSVFDSDSMTSSQIEEKIQELSKLQNDIFLINYALLKKIEPDLIISQGLCDVCSPHNREIDKSVQCLDNKPDTLILDPHTIDDIIQNIMDIAIRVGKESKGLEIKHSLIKRIEKVSSYPSDKKPKVICIEWIEPLYICGHWVPQMVEIAGGINGISGIGDKSHKIDLTQISGFDPDIIILMPCGFDLSKVLVESASLHKNPQWNSLRAVQNDMVYAVDALSYFSRPSPRIITGIEILSKIINPESFVDSTVPPNSYTRLRRVT